VVLSEHQILTCLEGQCAAITKLGEIAMKQQAALRAHRLGLMRLMDQCAPARRIQKRPNPLRTRPRTWTWRSP
jgi:hypothetical protein